MTSTYNIQLIDFNTFFKEQCQIPILDTLFIYKLFDNNKQVNLRNKEVKNIITYHIAFYACKIFKSSNNDNTVLVVQPNIIDGEGFIDYCDIDTLKNQILKFLKTFKISYPKNIVILKNPMDITNIDSLKLIFNKLHSPKRL